MKTSVRQFIKNRKTWTASIAVLTISGFAFAAGKKYGAEPSPAVTAVEEGVGASPEPTGLDKEGKKKQPNRKPASEKPEPAQQPEREEIEREEAEEEIQIAHQAIRSVKADDDVRSKHTQAKAERTEKAGHGKADHSSDHEEVPVNHASKKSRGSDHAKTEPDHHADQPTGFWARIKAAFVNVHHEVVRLQQTDEENRKLKIENAQLRVMLETQKFDCRVSEAKKHAEKVGAKLNAQTGTRVGRALASIQYQIPENLLPEQLHALGVSYLKAEDYERAAAILTFLTDLEGDSTYKTPENFMMVGIAWYKLENFKSAEQAFERALKDPTASQKIRTQSKVWHALIAQRSKNYAGAQEWLRRTLEKDPQSKEAYWINPQEGINRQVDQGMNRQPASKSKSKPKEEHHAETPKHH